LYRLYRVIHKSVKDFKIQFYTVGFNTVVSIIQGYS